MLAIPPLFPKKGIRPVFGLLWGILNPAHKREPSDDQTVIKNGPIFDQDTKDLIIMERLFKKILHFFYKEWFLLVMLIAIGLIVLLFETL